MGVATPLQITLTSSTNQQNDTNSQTVLKDSFQTSPTSDISKISQIESDTLKACIDIQSYPSSLISNLDKTQNQDAILRIKRDKRKIYCQRASILIMIAVQLITAMIEIGDTITEWFFYIDITNNQKVSDGIAVSYLCFIIISAIIIFCFYLIPWTPYYVSSYCCQLKIYAMLHCDHIQTICLNKMKILIN